MERTEKMEIIKRLMENPNVMEIDNFLVTKYGWKEGVAIDIIAENVIVDGMLERLELCDLAYIVDNSTPDYIDWE